MNLKQNALLAIFWGTTDKKKSRGSPSKPSARGLCLVLSSLSFPATTLQRCKVVKHFTLEQVRQWDNIDVNFSVEPRNQRSSWGMSSHLPRVCVRNLSGITRIRLEVAGSFSLLVCLYNPIQISYSPNWARHKYWDMARKYEPRFLAVSGTVLNHPWLTGSEIWSHTHISSAFLNQIEIW